MAGLSLKHIYKVYDGKVKAVNDFCMEIEDREFIVFVGPSGCGKSTTLRMIAGLEDITAGELRIDGQVVNDLEPKDRNIAMVFQNYALYPHMTVYENMAFSLRIARLPREEIDKKVRTASEILGISEFLERKPKALSGGQRQRVALGRAIVRNPKVFLLDEPLSNLDAKLRADMRAEISRLHEKLKTTFIYVTHDQVEAMTMGTRIVVMKSGYVQQVDTPHNIYQYPSNMFVAGFIGTPQINFFDGYITRQQANVSILLDVGLKIDVPFKKINKVPTKYMDGQTKIVVGIRPDSIKIYSSKHAESDWQKVIAKVSIVEDLGSETIIYASIDLDNIDNPKSLLTTKIFSDKKYVRGDVIELAINKDNIHLFDKETENSIKNRIVKENYILSSVDGENLYIGSKKIALPPILRGQREKSECEVIIPSDAIRLGQGDNTTTIEGIENIDKIVQYQFNVGGHTLFCVEQGENKYKVKETLRYDIDFKLVEFKGKFSALPLNRANEIYGAFIKVKERKPDGKKGYNFYFQLGDKKFLATDSVCDKLFNSLGNKIFKTRLKFLINIDDAKVIDANDYLVKDVLDYGKDKYAIVDAFDTQVYLPITNHKKGDKIGISIDVDKLVIVNAELDIIIA